MQEGEGVWVGLVCYWLILCARMACWMDGWSYGYLTMYDRLLLLLSAETESILGRYLSIFCLPLDGWLRLALAVQREEIVFCMIISARP